MKYALICSALLVGALSTGCGGDGGGGGGSASQLNPSSYELQSIPAPAEPFTVVSTALTTDSGGNSYAGTYSETPNSGTTMFDGQEANSSTISLTITENGSPIVAETDTAYY
jgi:hypothetical protein